MSGILPVMGRRGQGCKNCRRMAINTLVQQLYREEEVVFVGMFCWGGADIYMRDGLHLSGKGVQQCLLMNYQKQSKVAWEA